MPSKLPRVAIVGKPNVGKSTLFNRLVGRRKAITDRVPGVTRDTVEQEAVIDERRVLLVDTGGVTDARDGIEAQVGERSVEEARKASLVLLVVDVTEVSGEDERFIQELRPLSRKIILVINKTDNDERDGMAWEHYRHGFERTLSVSAVSGRNLPELRSAIVAALPPPDDPDAPVEEPSEEAVIRLAIVGKPNTGKSTLLNRLLGEERSLVSPVPGTTRDVVEGSFVRAGVRFHVLDTAGIRRKSSVKTSVEFYSVNRALKSVESCDVALLLIDSLDSVSDQDKKIASVAARLGHGIILGLNKWDAVKKVPNILTAMQDRVSFLFPVLHFAPVLPLSSKTGFGIERVLDAVVRIQKQLCLRVQSAPLNRAVEAWQQEYPIPSRGKNLKIRFIAQTGLRPTRFTCHVNRKRSFPQLYVRYLENKIRKEFGLDMIPLLIELEDRD